MASAIRQPAGSSSVPLINHYSWYYILPVSLQASQATSVNKPQNTRNTGFFQISIPSRPRRRNIATEGSLSIVPYPYKNFIGKNTDIQEKAESEKVDSRTV